MNFFIFSCRIRASSIDGNKRNFLRIICVCFLLGMARTWTTMGHFPPTREKSFVLCWQKGKIVPRGVLLFLVYCAQRSWLKTISSIAFLSSDTLNLIQRNVSLFNRLENCEQTQKPSIDRLRPVFLDSTLDGSLEPGVESIWFLHFSGYLQNFDITKSSWNQLRRLLEERCSCRYQRMQRITLWQRCVTIYV